MKSQDPTTLAGGDTMHNMMRTDRSGGNGAGNFLKPEYSVSLLGNDIKGAG